MSNNFCLVKSDIDISDLIKNNNEDPGEPLFLTPLIESGRLEEGRLKSQVLPSFVTDPVVDSHAGYLTVNKEYNSNLFFWYFKSEGNPDKDPTVVWLQGGPGSSSLFGLFNENGPYIITKDKILKRPHTWSKVSNLIFFDNPVGTGYSFTDNKLGYARNQTQVGNDLYSAILQLFQLFPHLQKNDLYVTGESYAGKYVPAFGHAIQRKNNDINSPPQLKVKLRGLMIGNAWTDPENMLQYGNYLYQLGLIDQNGRKQFRRIESEARKNIKKKNWKRAAELIDELVGDETSLYYKYTGLTGYYNYYNIKSGDWEDYEEKFVTSNYFRQAVHVGNKTYNNGLDVYNNLYEDVPKSVISWVAQLLKEYRVLFYNGQLDIICAYPLTESYLRNMKWPLQKKYLNAKRYIYKVNDDVAGYYKTTGHLTDVLIRDAGHMVPTDQPVWALQLLTDFIYNNVTYHKEEVSDAASNKSFIIL